MKKILLILACAINTVYAAQSIQIIAYLPADSSDANLMLIIDDIDSGTTTPASMYLHSGNNLQTFQVKGDHYQIIPVKLSAPNIQFTPCSTSPIIDHHSLIMTITGKISSDTFKCTYRQTTTLPQLYAPVSPKIVAAPAHSANTGQAEIAKYLTNLSQGCQQGIFNAKFSEQKAEYDILGMKSGACEVSISTSDNKKPLLCQFTPEDIMYMASPEKISQAQAGQAKYSPGDLSVQIMKTRCHSL